MSITVKTSDQDDDSPVTLEWTNTEHDDQYTVQIWLSPVDGVTVVQIDTPPNVGRVRVMLNDGPIWDGDPDNDEVPGAEFADHPVIRMDRLETVRRLRRALDDETISYGELALIDELAQAADIDTTADDGQMTAIDVINALEAHYGSRA